jgi:hypothetical protein
MGGVILSESRIQDISRNIGESSGIAFRVLSKVS